MSVLIKDDMERDCILPESCAFIPQILHGEKNVFIKKRYLGRRKDYLCYSLLNTATEKVRSYTVQYSENNVLRRFYTGLPMFIPADTGNCEVKEFREYIDCLNRDIINFLSARIDGLCNPDDPLGVYIIPELINNGAKANYLIEKRYAAMEIRPLHSVHGILEILCIQNRKRTECIDIIFRNYARFHQSIEESIEKALHCHWTDRTKLKKEKIHRFNSESSEYGLPSVKNALRKYYNGELFYDGYDDSFSDFGAYQFTLRLPVNSCSVE